MRGEKRGGEAGRRGCREERGRGYGGWGVKLTTPAPSEPPLSLTPGDSQPWLALGTLHCPCPCPKVISNPAPPRVTRPKPPRPHFVLLTLARTFS